MIIGRKIRNKVNGGAPQPYIFSDRARQEAGKARDLYRKPPPRETKREKYAFCPAYSAHVLCAIVFFRVTLLIFSSHSGVV